MTTCFPFSYTNAATLSERHGVPSFRFTGYTAQRSSDQDPTKDVALLAKEVESIHKTWPTSRIVLLGHSGGGLVVERYWQNYAYKRQNVQLAISIEGPFNGTAAASACLPTCPSAFGFGFKVLNFLGSLWNNQPTNDQIILSRDKGNSFLAISTEGDSAYGRLTNGRYDSIVPDSVFPCDVTGLAILGSPNCPPAQPPTLVDGGVWPGGPCEWTSALQDSSYFGGRDYSHFYAIGCPDNILHIGEIFNPNR